MCATCEVGISLMCCTCIDVRRVHRSLATYEHMSAFSAMLLTCNVARDRWHIPQVCNMEDGRYVIDGIYVIGGIQVICGILLT